jgi:hypothetical protein
MSMNGVIMALQSGHSNSEAVIPEKRDDNPHATEHPQSQADNHEPLDRPVNAVLIRYAMGDRVNGIQTISPSCVMRVFLPDEFVRTCPANDVIMVPEELCTGVDATITTETQSYGLFKTKTRTIRVRQYVSIPPGLATTGHIS